MLFCAQSGTPSRSGSSWSSDPPCKLWPSPVFSLVQLSVSNQLNQHVHKSSQQSNLLTYAKVIQLLHHIVQLCFTAVFCMLQKYLQQGIHKAVWLVLCSDTFKILNYVKSKSCHQCLNMRHGVCFKLSHGYVIEYPYRCITCFCWSFKLF